MEYGWEDRERIEGYKCGEGGKVDEEEMLRCAEVQVKDASHILKLALDKLNIINYNDCNGKVDVPLVAPNSHLICVLSVYFTGEKSKFFGTNNGKDFAKETIEIMDFLEGYFS